MDKLELINHYQDKIDKIKETVSQLYLDKDREAINQIAELNKTKSTYATFVAQLKQLK